MNKPPDQAARVKNHLLSKKFWTVLPVPVLATDDPAFKKPNKPIGSFMSEKDAQEHKQNSGWDIVEEAGRGWRRVVARASRRCRSTSNCADEARAARSL